MNLLVKFPTRGRPDVFFKTLDSYYELAEDKSKLFFLITLDADDSKMNNYEINEKLLNYDNLQFIYGQSKNKINAVNRDFEFVEFDYDIILLASDDMVPQVKNYDSIIRKNMIEIYPDTDGILFFDDGFKKNELNTLCILGKKYFNRFKYIYYPGYKSLFADNEFMSVGYLLNKQTYIDQCIIKHEHPDNGFSSIRIDEVYNLNYINYEFDKELFVDRQKNNFFLEF